MKRLLKIKEENSAITLIALILTIIVLIILAGVTLNLLMGENGILTRAKSTSKIYNEEQSRESVQMALFSLQVELESQGKSVKISDLSKLPEYDSSIEVDVDTESEEALITYDSKYVFTLYKDENGNIVIAKDVQEAGKLKPRITKIDVEESILDHITIKVTANRALNYKYFIKTGTKNEAGSYTEYGSNSTGSFIYENSAERDELVVDATYTLKVVVSNDNGDVEDTKEVILGRIEQATGARVEATEVDGYATLKTVILPTKNIYKTQYQIGILDIEGTWIEYNSETKIPLTYETTVYYRYLYGETTGNYSEIVIDKIDREGPEEFTPKITTNSDDKTITIEANTLDEGVGVDYYEYNITPANSNEASGIIQINAEGKGIKTITMTQKGDYTITIKSIDKLGNETIGTGMPKTIELQDKVTLNANGGTFEDGTSIKEIVYTEGRITLPNASQENKALRGWYQSDLTTKIGNEGEEVEVTNNTTLYALYYDKSTNPTPESADDSRILRGGFGSGSIVAGYTNSSYPHAYGSGNPTYLGWDFEEPVYVYGYYFSLRATRYAIEYTDDLDEEWTTVITRNLSGAAYGTSADMSIDNSEENGAHQYWRIRILNGYSDYSPMISNLHFRIMY